MNTLYVEKQTDGTWFAYSFVNEVKTPVHNFDKNSTPRDIQRWGHSWMFKNIYITQ